MEGDEGGPLRSGSAALDQHRARRPGSLRQTRRLGVVVTPLAVAVARSYTAPMTDSLFARFGCEFPRGHVLFREGDRGDVMYVIQSGVIRVSKRVGGQDKLLALMGAGEFVGEMAILNARPRTATATVVEGPARCLRIDTQTLEVMVSKRADIAMRLIKSLSKRLDAADALLEILMHRDPKARTLLSLAHQAKEYGEKVPEGLLVRTSPSDIASQVGADPVLVQDLFARLRRLRLIEEARDGGFIVTELDRLREFIEFLGIPTPATRS